MNPAARWALGRTAFDVHERSPALSLTLGVPREWSDIDLDEQEAWCRSAEAVRAAVLAEKDVDAFNERIR